MKFNQTKLQIARDTAEAKKNNHVPVKEFMQLTGLSKQTIYTYIKSGEIKAKEFGGIVAIPIDEVEEIKKLLGK